MGVLNTCLTLVPNKSVTFEPNNVRQQADLIVENSGDKAVMFKMKSTRPGLYKMRPVYDVILPGTKKTIALTFKGFKANQKCPTNDRFTVVFTLAPTNIKHVDKIWNKHKYRSKMVDQEIVRKNISILYKGVNDTVPQGEAKDDFDDDTLPRGSIVKKAKGLIDDEMAANSQPASTEPTPTPAPQKGPTILVMYRQREEDWGDDSQSGDEEDSDDEKARDKKKDGEGKESEMGKDSEVSKALAAAKPSGTSVVNTKKTAPIAKSPAKSRSTSPNVKSKFEGKSCIEAPGFKPQQKKL